MDALALFGYDKVEFADLWWDELTEVRITPAAVWGAYEPLTLVHPLTFGIREDSVGGRSGVIR